LWRRGSRKNQGLTKRALVLILYFMIFKQSINQQVFCN
jgi:hypothetical protein